MRTILAGLTMFCWIASAVAGEIADRVQMLENERVLLQDRVDRLERANRGPSAAEQIRMMQSEMLRDSDRRAPVREEVVIKPFPWAR